MTVRPPQAVTDQFWALVSRGSDHWLWRGSETALAEAARFSLELRLGRRVIAPYQANSKCGVSGCVRPDHLYRGLPPELRPDPPKPKRERKTKGERKRKSDPCVCRKCGTPWTVLSPKTGKRGCRPCKLRSNRERARNNRRASGIPQRHHPDGTPIESDD